MLRSGGVPRHVHSSDTCLQRRGGGRVPPPPAARRAQPAAAPRSRTAPPATHPDSRSARPSVRGCPRLRRLSGGSPRSVSAEVGGPSGASARALHAEAADGGWAPRGDLSVCTGRSRSTLGPRRASGSRGGWGSASGRWAPLPHTRTPKPSVGLGEGGSLAVAFPTPPALADGGAAAESRRPQSASAGEASSGRPPGRQRHRAASRKLIWNNRTSTSTGAG